MTSQLAGSLLSVMCLIRLIDESARWLIAEERDEEARDILQHITNINRTQLPAQLNLEENRPENVSIANYSYTFVTHNPGKIQKTQ